MREIATKGRKQRVRFQSASVCAFQIRAAEIVGYRVGRDEPTTIWKTSWMCVCLCIQEFVGVFSCYNMCVLVHGENVECKILLCCLPLA